MNKKEAEQELVRATKTAAHAVGKNNGMSGRGRFLLPYQLNCNQRLTISCITDLFTFNPDLGNDSDDEGDDDEWLQLLKIRAEKEKREAEIERYVLVQGFARGWSDLTDD